MKPKPGAIQPADLEEAQASILAFLAAVDAGELGVPVPREMAIVRRLQGAADTLGVLIGKPSGGEPLRP